MNNQDAIPLSQETAPQRLPFRPLILPALLLLLGGWGGVVLTILYTVPTAGWRWVFFVCWVMAWSGSALPLLYLVHWFFPSREMSFAILGREAIWAGMYGAFLAWLQLGRMVTLPLALEIAAVFVLLELLLRWREQAHWTPPPEAGEVKTSTPSQEAQGQLQSTTSQGQLQSSYPTSGQPLSGWSTRGETSTPLQETSESSAHVFPDEPSLE